MNEPISNKYYNHVERMHYREKIIGIDSVPWLGTLVIDRTDTYENQEPKSMYTFSDSGPDLTQIGGGFNAGGWLGFYTAIDSSCTLTVGAQLTPIIHAELELGMQGFGGVLGFDIGNTSIEIEGSIGVITAILWVLPIGEFEQPAYAY